MISQKKCTVENKFYFNWTSLIHGSSKPLILENAVLYAYLDDIPRLLAEDGQAIPVNISTHVGFSGSNETFPAGPSEIINVTNNTKGRRELDITQGLLRADFPYGCVANNMSCEVYIEISLSVDCDVHKKVPVRFSDPAEINITDQAVKRQRYKVLQPLLVVFLNNYSTRKQLNPVIPYGVLEHGLFDDDGLFDDAEMNKRRKRSYSDCQLENFNVTFPAVGLYSIISPTILDIKTCTGNCRGEYFLATKTDHARVMGAAIRHNKHPINKPQLCCVPTVFELKYLLILLPHYETTMLKPVDSLVVKECGCT